MFDVSFWNGIWIGLMIGMTIGGCVGVFIMAAFNYRSADPEEGD